MNDELYYEGYSDAFAGQVDRRLVGYDEYWQGHVDGTGDLTEILNNTKPRKHVELTDGSMHNERHQATIDS